MRHVGWRDALLVGHSLGSMLVQQLLVHSLNASTADDNEPKFTGVTFKSQIDFDFKPFFLFLMLLLIFRNLHCILH